MTEPGTPTGAAAANHEAGMPITARLAKHPTVSDLLQGRRGSRPGSVSSSPRNAPSPLPAALDSPQPGRQQQLAGSPLRPGAAKLLHPALPCGSSSEQAQQAGPMHIVELQPMAGEAPAAAGWQQPHYRHSARSHLDALRQPDDLGWQQQQQQQHDGRWRPGSSAASEAAEDDSAALLSGLGSKSGGGQRSMGAAAAAGERGGGWLARLARGLRQVDWEAAFPLPSQAAIAGERGSADGLGHRVHGLAATGCRAGPLVWSTSCSSHQARAAVLPTCVAHASLAVQAS